MKDGQQSLFDAIPDLPAAPAPAPVRLDPRFGPDEMMPPEPQAEFRREAMELLAIFDAGEGYSEKDRRFVAGWRRQMEAGRLVNRLRLEMLRRTVASYQAEDTKGDDQSN